MLSKCYIPIKVDPTSETMSMYCQLFINEWVHVYRDSKMFCTVTLPQ